jgi:hypothetical protein
MSEGIMTRRRCRIRIGSRRRLAAMALQRHVGRLSEQAVVELHSNPYQSDRRVLRRSGVLSVADQGGGGATCSAVCVRVYPRCQDFDVYQK